MTLIEIINAKNALKNYFEKTPPNATMYKIIKLIKYAEEQEKYFNEVLNQLLQKYGERDAAGKFIIADEGKGYKIKQEFSYKYLTDYLALQNTGLDDFTPTITLAELSPLEIKLGDMYHILPVIKNA